MHRSYNRLPTCRLSEGWAFRESDFNGWLVHGERTSFGRLIQLPRFVCIHSLIAVRSYTCPSEASTWGKCECRSNDSFSCDGSQRRF